MKVIGILVLIFSFISCSSFTKISEETRVGSEDNHVKVFNTKANFKSLTFGDFKFATNRRQFRRISDSKPEFKDILFYAKTVDPAYDYYVLMNPSRKPVRNDKYKIIDTIIGGSNFILVISLNAPKSDLKYIENHIAPEN